ncbi:CoA ester lyase [Corynebacterium sp. CCM 9204]|uniref:HpcH/HpaI aldolase/citrate lyase family protein n=1 Tax=Corynebacterium sp. CCM 9204 TaxID=3057616 RepID=UPI0035232035
MTGSNDHDGRHPVIVGPALLFAPANRPERFVRAAESADMVILDLEDGAGSCSREDGRRNIAESGLDSERTIVRVCGPSDPGFVDDVSAVRGSPYRTVIVPKIIDHVPDAVRGLNVIALIETPQAVLNLGELAADPDVVGLYWGAEDLCAYLGGTHSRFQPDEGAPADRPGHYRDALRLSRSLMHLHAAAVGKFVVDAVHADFHDDRGLYEEATDAARSGFAATACIHPRQVDVIRRAYAPEPGQLARARLIVKEAAQHPGAFKINGEMIDAPLIAQARRLVSRAG